MDKKTTAEAVAAGVPGGGKRPKPPAWVRLGRLLYNPKSGAVLTRTPLSWVKLLLLTLLYWSIVIVSALLCWVIFQVAASTRQFVPHPNCTMDVA